MKDGEKFGSVALLDRAIADPREGVPLQGPGDPLRMGRSPPRRKLLKPLPYDGLKGISPTLACFLGLLLLGRIDPLRRASFDSRAFFLASIKLTWGYFPNERSYSIPPDPVIHPPQLLPGGGDVEEEPHIIKKFIGFVLGLCIADLNI